MVDDKVPAAGLGPGAPGGGGDDDDDNGVLFHDFGIRSLMLCRSTGKP